MLERVGLDRRGLRNFAIVVAIITFVMSLQYDGTVFVRLVSGLITGLLAGAVFLAVTVTLYLSPIDTW